VEAGEGVEVGSDGDHRGGVPEGGRAPGAPLTPEMGVVVRERRGEERFGGEVFLRNSFARSREAITALPPPAPHHTKKKPLPHPPARTPAHPRTHAKHTHSLPHKHSFTQTHAQVRPRAHARTNDHNTGAQKMPCVTMCELGPGAGTRRSSAVGADPPGKGGGILSLNVLFIFRFLIHQICALIL